MHGLFARELHWRFSVAEARELEVGRGECSKGEEKKRWASM